MKIFLSNTGRLNEIAHKILPLISERLSVSCVNCYVKGQAHATLTVSPDFNISSALKIFAEEFITEIDNITETVWDTFKNWTEVVVHNTTDVIEYDLAACTIKITSGHCTSSQFFQYHDSHRHFMIFREIDMC